MRIFILTVSRKGGWTVHVERMAASRREYMVVVGTETARYRGEDDRKEMRKVWVWLIWLRIETVRRVLVNMVMDYRLYRYQQMHYSKHIVYFTINPLNAELNPICYLLGLLEVHHIPHVSRIRVNILLHVSSQSPSSGSLHQYYFN
jgi:hypothetical protein